MLLRTQSKDSDSLTSNRPGRGWGAEGDREPRSPEIRHVPFDSSESQFPHVENANYPHTLQDCHREKNKKKSHSLTRGKRLEQTLHHSKYMAGQEANDKMFPITRREGTAMHTTGGPVAARDEQERNARPAASEDSFLQSQSRLRPAALLDVARVPCAGPRVPVGCPAALPSYTPGVTTKAARASVNVP